MARSTKIVGLSLPPETHKKIESYIKKNHKTRSEFYRQMIDSYFTKNETFEKYKPRETDIASALRNYWELKSKTKLRLIIVGLGIITNKKREVLIGERKQKDKWVEYLSWVFPGGEIKSLDFTNDIKQILKNETGLNTTINNLISVRIHPDSGFKNVQIIAFYFHCTAKSSTSTPSHDLTKLKWVKPLSVFKYFTTSTSDDVTKFLATLEKSKNT